MSWEIQGHVETAADIDRLVAAPTEKPSDVEAHQVDQVATALKDLYDAGVVHGRVFVRAGGHANEGGGPAEGQPHEMVTLTIDFAPLTDAEQAAAAANEAPAEGSTSTTEG